MPACKMNFNGKGAKGGLSIRNTDFSKGLFGNQVDPELAIGGGASVPVMNKRAEVAAPPVKASAGSTKRGGGLFG